MFDFIEFDNQYLFGGNQDLIEAFLILEMLEDEREREIYMQKLIKCYGVEAVSELLSK